VCLFCVFVFSFLLFCLHCTHTNKLITYTNTHTIHCSHVVYRVYMFVFVCLYICKFTCIHQRTHATHTPSHLAIAPLHFCIYGCCGMLFHFQKPPLSDAANGRWGPLGAYSMVQPDGQVNQRHTSTLSVYTTNSRVCVHAYVCI
jgi:hypothetical protein